MDESILDQHFAEHTEVKEEVVDFDIYDVIAFTDGSCISKKGKSGGSGVYFHSKISELHQIKILEHMPKSELLYMGLDNEIIFNGNEIDFSEYCFEEDCTNIGYAKVEDMLACSKHKNKDSKVVATYIRHIPTNIRAEGNAILLAIRAMVNMMNSESKTKTQDINGVKVTSLKLTTPGAINRRMLIITDSKFWIDSIRDWLPGWIANRKLMERKNIDIISKLILSINQLTDLGVGLDFLHVRGHQDSKKEELSFQEKGNVIADKLATHASAMERFGIFITK